jgi:hypothetical protein
MWPETAKGDLPPVAGLPAREETGDPELSDGRGVDTAGDGSPKEEAFGETQIGLEGRREALHVGVLPETGHVEGREAGLKGEASAAGRFGDLGEDRSAA